MRLDDAPSPGWYPDPEGSARLRFWLGDDWSDRYRARPPSVAGPTPLGYNQSAAAQQPTPPPAQYLPGWSGQTNLANTAQIVDQVRMAAREEAQRASQLFGAQARSATQNLTPLITEYTNKITRIVKLLTRLAVLVFIAWLVFQMFAQQSLFEWIGNRIDHLTDQLDQNSGVLIRLSRG